MKQFWKNLTPKQIVLAITGVLSLGVFLVLNLVGTGMVRHLESQNMAKRWSKEGGASQISCFFSANSAADENTVLSFEHTLDAALQEASITSESANANARLWADAYSTSGKLNLVGKTGQMDVNAIGAGGDFFLFHPLKLINGGYFSGSDLMQDHILIDEDIAWQLFGSNDVVGQQITIDGIPHLVSGVIRRDSGRLNDHAGNGSSIAYVSYETMKKHLESMGQSASVNHYEIVMPNPVSGFAYGIVKDKIGIDEKEMELVENSTRFGLLPLLRILGNFGMRSMNGKAIIYPYWENIARAYEDILALLLIFKILFLLYPMVLLVTYLVYRFRRRTWHWNDVKRFAQKTWEDLQSKGQDRKRLAALKEKDEEEPWL